MRRLVFFALVGCAGAPRSGTARARPSREAVHRALEGASARAQRCLAGADDRVTVEGFFDGRSGRFLIERVGGAGATGVTAQQCVALAMEEAHVRPFARDRWDASWTVASHEVSAAVRAMMAQDASVPPAIIEGAIDPSAVMTIIRAEMPEIRRCYEDALRGTPTLGGRVAVRFTISMDGRIVASTSSGPRGFYYVSHCIVGHLRALQLPRPTGAPVDFDFPFNFRPEARSSRDAGVIQDAPP